LNPRLKEFSDQREQSAIADLCFQASNEFVVWDRIETAHEVDVDHMDLADLQESIHFP
jgi:thiamine monophosphate synthase